MKKIQLVDNRKKVVNGWEEQFGNCENVVIHYGDLFELKTDCHVSAANSLGFIDGGSDKVYLEVYGNQLQERLQKEIHRKPIGEVLVGEVLVIETKHPAAPYFMCAPTMRVPMKLEGQSLVNIYLASKAIFANFESNDSINTISIPGLGTGIGAVDPVVSARLMKKAYEEVILKEKKIPSGWWEFSRSHQALYTDKFKDLQK
jgi:O-acetyl-ADP-ribose deacetylase (regulator of RNase III)